MMVATIRRQHGLPWPELSETGRPRVRSLLLLHGPCWWPSSSAVDDPPDMRNRSRTRSRLRLRRLEPEIAPPHQQESL
jgi:hypothetical protein